MQSVYDEVNGFVNAISEYELRMSNRAQSEPPESRESEPPHIA
jgi:hypothetical protein